MTRRSLRQVVTALVLLVFFAGQVTWALAGTTGGLSGVVVDAQSNAPIAGAEVTASSPSQSSTQKTDASGRFSFLTLAPDTYTVTVTKENYQPLSVPGQIVFADTVQTVTAQMQKALTTIAHVTAIGAGALVKSGTTADLYSVNAATQQTVGALGGGGSLNQAYSAIATIPGAYVVPNQTGYYETVNIRGGDYDQVGYEFDGVPVNRAFDNYGSSSANSLGNAEVEVYTGATPANSEGQGLSGYINQVIKTGTYPGYGEGSLGIATPAFYHRAAVEAGGSTPDRLFSYYVGIAASNQAYNYVDNTNGAGYSQWLGVVSGIIPNNSFPKECELGSVFCFPGGNQLAMGPIQYANFSAIYSRNVVGNFHFAIPHHHDSGRDDVQILFDNESLSNQLYESPNDFASAECGSAGGIKCAEKLYGPQLYPNTASWGCPGAIGGTFTANQLNAISPCVTSYGFPNAPDPGTLTNPNPVNAFDRDHTYNTTSIEKLQYTKNFGASAFLRVYGYAFYSTWDLAGTLGDLDCDFACTVAPDYELDTHTRGLSAQFQDQINAQNLISVQGAYTTASVLRDNNHFYALGPDGNTAVVVNSKSPYSGYCFAPTGSAVTDCAAAGVPLAYGYGTGTSPFGPAAPQLTGTCAIPGQPQYGKSCSYMVAENGLNGEYGNVTPNFYGWSLTDEWRPTDRWLIDAGLRLDTYGFQGGQTVTPPLGPGSADARQFWFNAFNLDNCISTTTGFVSANPKPGAVCPSGSTGTYLENQSSQQYAYNIYEPRLAGTYTLDHDNVFRFSAGRYSESPSTAFVQYNTRQEDLADFIGDTFLQYGRNTPGYTVQPQTSLNYDVSWEHHFKGTDWSFKVSPYLRQTQNQVQEFFLNAKEGFVSGLNAGNQRSQGVEFQAQKGDFSRDGISGLLSFAYTNSYIKYFAVNQYGATVIAGVNGQIQQYNGYTRACVQNPTNPNCGPTSNGQTANACYTSAGNPVGAVSITGNNIHCPAGDIANPYWFSGIQSVIDQNQEFQTYDLFPGSTAFPGAYSGFNTPYVASLVLNYKHQKLAITPSFQFQGGTKYGYPLSSVGIDPAAGGCTPLPGSSRQDSTTCNSVVNIPNPYTGVFDNPGSFTQPNEFMMNLQLTYDVSPRVTLIGTMANIVNYCFGGTPEPWTFSDGNLCSYQGAGSLLDPVAPYGTPGSTANPPGSAHGSIIQPLQKYPYLPTFGPNLAAAANTSTKTPFQFYVTAKIKL